jgi:3-deoxy-D-manno-octulosonate 8-phosphate phosphatase (KDO 8-P phosphatase)
MNSLSLFKLVSTFIFDVDGVMTDGTLLVLEDGQFARRMHIRDGYALQLAVRLGYGVAVISGGRSQAVAARLQVLGITDVFLGVEDKAAVLETYLREKQLDRARTLYMGDDIPDLAAIRMAALRTAPRDACPEIRAECQYISPLKGGEGCVRDVIEKVLRLRGDWPAHG